MIKCAITLHTVTVLWVYGGSRVVPYASQGVVSQFIPPPPILAELGHLTVINGVFPSAPPTDLKKDCLVTHLESVVDYIWH